MLDNDPGGASMATKIVVAISPVLAFGELLRFSMFWNFLVQPRNSGVECYRNSCLQVVQQFIQRQDFQQWLLRKQQHCVRNLWYMFIKGSGLPSNVGVVGQVSVQARPLFSS